MWSEKTAAVCLGPLSQYLLMKSGHCNISTRHFSILLKIDIVWSAALRKLNLKDSKHKRITKSLDSLLVSFSSLFHNGFTRQRNHRTVLPDSKRMNRSIFGIPVSMASICIPSSCLSLLNTFGVELLLPISSIINEVVMSRFAEK